MLTRLIGQKVERAPGTAVHGGQSTRRERHARPAVDRPGAARRLHHRLRAGRQHGDRADRLPEGPLRHVQGFRADPADGVEFPGAGRAPQRAVQEREGPRRLRQGQPGKAGVRHQRRRRVHPFLGRAAAHHGRLHLPARPVQGRVRDHHRHHERTGRRDDLLLHLALSPHHLRQGAAHRDRARTRARPSIPISRRSRKRCPATRTAAGSASSRRPRCRRSRSRCSTGR